MFATRFITLFRFGWGWLILLLAVCATYYSTSVARMRRRARDDIQRELVQSRLASEHESAEWLNHFFQRFWVIYEPVLSATIVATVDQLLSANCPPFLDSLRLNSFTLGNKAFRIDRVRTFPKTDQDIVMMDWAVSFTPNDVSDMTPREVKKKVNPRIALLVRVGKGLATTGMPILLEDLSFSGQMRVRLKLMTNFPHVQLVDFMFLEPPLFDYVLKPIGGEHFGFDIGNVSTTQVGRHPHINIVPDSRTLLIHPKHGPQHLGTNDVRPTRLHPQPRADAFWCPSQCRYRRSPDYRPLCT